MKHLISGILTAILSLILYWFLAVRLRLRYRWGSLECYENSTSKCTTLFDISQQQDIIVLLIIFIIFIPIVYGIIYWILKSFAESEWDFDDPESEQDSDETDETDIEGKKERLEEEIKQLEAEEEIKQLEKRIKELKKKK